MFPDPNNPGCFIPDRGVEFIWEAEMKMVPRRKKGPNQGFKQAYVLIQINGSGHK
jgi:hypothetical protein